MKNASWNFRVSLFYPRVWVWALFFTLLSAVWPAMSFAQFGATLKAGTPGIGGDLTLGLHPKLNTRVGFNVFWFGLTESETDEEEESVGEIQADLKWLTIPMLLDWHPWESGIRLSFGAMINNNQIDLSAEADSVEINEVEYVVDSLDGKVSFNTFSPYLGVGYGNAADISGHWHFACDLGVMFQGSPKVEMNAVATNPLLQAALDADLEAEVDEIEEEFKEITMYPVLSLGVSYTF